MADFTFHHGGVSVPSLDEAIDWYGRVLGFAVEKRFYIEAARSHAAMVRKGALRFELFEVEGAAPGGGETGLAWPGVARRSLARAPGGTP